MSLKYKSMPGLSHNYIRLVLIYYPLEKICNGKEEKSFRSKRWSLRNINTQRQVYNVSNMSREIETTVLQGIESS